MSVTLSGSLHRKAMVRPNYRSFSQHTMSNVASSNISNLILMHSLAWNCRVKLSSWIALMLGYQTSQRWAYLMIPDQWYGYAYQYAFERVRGEYMSHWVMLIEYIASRGCQSPLQLFMMGMQTCSWALDSTVRFARIQCHRHIRILRIYYWRNC